MVLRTIEKARQRRKEPQQVGLPRNKAAAVREAEPLFPAGEAPTTGVYPSSAFEAMGRGHTMSWLHTVGRWKSIFDDDELVPIEQQQEMIGDRGIEPDPNYDLRQLQFLIEEHDEETYMQSYDQRPIMELLGGIPAALADPVSVATMPIGGPGVRAATQAGVGAGQFLRHTLTAGAKISVAAAPLEAAIHQKTYGEFRPDMFLLSTLAPIVATPVVSLPGRLLSGVGGRGATATDIAQRAERVAPEAMPDGPNVFMSRLQALDTYPGVRTKPMQSSGGDVRMPEGRLTEMFHQYQGGYRQAVQDLSAGLDRARDFFRRQGVDPDAAPMQRFLLKHREGTAQRGGPAQFDEYVAVENYARRQYTADDLEVLLRRGIVDEPTGEPRGPFRDFVKAMRKSPDKRTDLEVRDIESFHRKGAEGMLGERLQRLRGQYDETVDNLRRLDEQVQGYRAKAKAPPRYLKKQIQELETRRNRLYDEFRDTQVFLQRTDGEFNIGELMMAIDASRSESVIPTRALDSRPMTRSTAPEPAAGSGPDAQMQNAVQNARKTGVDDVDGIARETDNIREQIRRC